MLTREQLSKQTLSQNPLSADMQGTIKVNSSAQTQCLLTENVNMERDGFACYYTVQPLLGIMKYRIGGMVSSYDEFDTNYGNITN